MPRREACIGGRKERAGGGCGAATSASSPPRRSGRIVPNLARLVALLRCARACDSFVATGGAPPPPPPPRCRRSSALARPPSPSWRGRRSAARFGPGGGATALEAFWSRGSDADGSTSPKDDRTVGGNSLWRKLSRRDGTDDISASNRRRSGKEADAGRRQRRGGGGGGGGRALSVQTRSRSSSSERYFYSASYLAELCPSFPEDGMEECVLDDEFYDRYLAQPEQQQLRRAEPPRWAWMKNLGGRIIESALADLVDRHAMHTLNLRFDAASSSSSPSLPPQPPQLVPLLVRGDVGSVTATFDRVAFPRLKVSGGGAVSARGLTVNALSFAPLVGRYLGRRFRDAFELRAEGCVFTQEDVRRSEMLRDGLSTLLDRILKRVVANAHEVLEVAVAGVEDFVRVDVTEVDILDYSDKLSCSGAITTKADHPDVPFEFRTGLSVTHLGRVLRFPGMEMILNPSSPLPVVLPLHVWHPVDLDIGPDATLDEVCVDGRRGRVRVSARAVVTPGRVPDRSGGNVVGPPQSSAGAEKDNSSTDGGVDGNENGPLPGKRRGTSATAHPSRQLWARYSCDVAEWLTNVGRFTS